MEHSGSTQSVWMATATRPDFTPLAQNASTDVVIVGAGIAGLTTAYLLGREGKSVIVVDSGPIISGETERTTAHLASALDDRFVELEKMHGGMGARLAAESHVAAIDRIERIVREEAIDCGFERVDGYLFAPPAGEASGLLEAELAAAHRAGLTGATLVDRAPLPDFNTGPAIRFPNQGQFHPLRYLAALANAIVRNGGKIHAHTHVVYVEGGDDAGVRTEAGHVITARSVVVATNSPINDRVVIHTKQAPYRTYVVGFRVRRGSVPMALYWDTLDPYHYVRLTAGTDDGHDFLIVGGEDHRTGQENDADARYQRLERWTRERFSTEGGAVFRWSGQVTEPVDGLAFIGRNPVDHENVYIATGDSGQGMTHGTLAGIIITDLIVGRENRWAALYEPARSSVLRDMREFVRDGANMVLQYAKWLTPGDTDDETTVPRGCGAVIRQGAGKIAVYCDDEGHIHECSAVCTHLGAIVSWNQGERTWDCPAHGSRFDAFGKVVNGPAKQDLEPVHVAAKI